jgi:hypothetical protein
MLWRSAILLLIASQSLIACSSRTGYIGTPGVTSIATEVPTDTSHPSQDSAQGCYYVWATRPLTELSNKLQSDIAATSALVQASAYAFGEDCRQPDGTTTFLAMETDFRVRLPVSAVTDEAAMGDWISRVMLMIEAIPATELPGTRPGRVEFEFTDDASRSVRATVEIQRYRIEAQDLSGALLFRYFQNPP